jgi:hypothetical protein
LLDATKGWGKITLFEWNEKSVVDPVFTGQQRKHSFNGFFLYKFFGTKSPILGGDGGGKEKKLFGRKNIFYGFHKYLY